MEMGWNFPTLAVKLDGRKINYYDFLTSTENEDCMAAVRRVRDRLDLREIDRFIENTPYITGLQKAFYKRYIGARASLILEPAPDSISGEDQEQIMIVISKD